MGSALLGDDLHGPTAAQTGLITRCVSPEELDPVVDAPARRLTGFSRAVQTRTKDLLDDT
jgi:2-(1,2-epoxy-1,2-dihydrophenyl)acetyl-CoA isomerase